MKREIGLVLLVALALTGYHWWVTNAPFRFQERQVVPWTHPNAEAFLQYRRRLVQWDIPDTFRVAEDIRALYGRARSGSIDASKLDYKADQLIRRLNDLNDDVTGRETPTVFLAGARFLVHGQGDFYRCLVGLQKLPESPNREATLKEAWSAWQAGYARTAAAQRVIRLDVNYDARWED